MTNTRDDFRERLLAAQPMTPALQEGYRRELDAILYEMPTLQGRVAAITLLVICAAVVIAEVRAMVIHPGSVGYYLGAAIMAITCAMVAFLIARDLVRGKSPRKNAFTVSEMFYGASWILVVIQCLHGLSTPGDPASTFNVLFVMAFAAVCTTWALANRITAAELGAKEQALRLECRLADLAEKLERKGAARGEP